MKRLPLLVALLLLGPAALAEGWSELSGATATGGRVEVSPSREWESSSRNYSLPENGNLYHVVVFESLVKSYSQARIFKDQRCIFSWGGRSNNWTAFTCSKSGTSPLAGTAYKAVPIRSCEYKSVLVCVRGCGWPDVPKRLNYRWSEGGTWDECEQPE